MRRSVLHPATVPAKIGWSSTVDAAERWNALGLGPLASPVNHVAVDQSVCRLSGA